MALNNGNTQQLRPTYYGYIDNTWDALVVVEAALGGGLTHIARRPHDREREHLIQSGSVFVYEENASGIKRWTDGLNWSPSRILGNFLIYRELETPFPPGEKKKATKKNLKSNSSRNGVSKASSDGGHQRSARVAGAIANAVGSQSPPPSEQERRLVGSLVDSYPFKKGGLLKKTISLNKGSVTHHVICYYSLEDVMHDMLLTPTSDPRLRSCIPRPELFENQSFRVALDHEGLF
ncbi:Gti1/Pac2 family-domain-containing protein, partial [Bombardia bombarda]